jgi:hypothetical protein
LKFKDQIKGRIMFRKKLTLYLLIILVLLCCVQKRTWQGEYTAVSYTSLMPKEDFKVGGYVVVGQSGGQNGVKS